MSSNKLIPGNRVQRAKRKLDAMKAIAFFFPGKCLWELIPGAPLSQLLLLLSLLPYPAQDSTDALMAQSWEHHGVHDGIQKSSSHAFAVQFIF